MLFGGKGETVGIGVGTWKVKIKEVIRTSGGSKLGKVRGYIALE